MIFVIIFSAFFFSVYQVWCKQCSSFSRFFIFILCVCMGCGVLCFNPWQLDVPVVEPRLIACWFYCSYCRAFQYAKGMWHYSGGTCQSGLRSVHLNCKDPE